MTGERARVAKRALLDTGFVVALVNGGDPDHRACVDVWAGVRSQLFSVDGVLVEAAHMLRKSPGGPSAAVGLIEAAGTTLVPVAEIGTERALALMEKYRDVPMDLVDALLVAVAERHAITDVLTLDRRGFSAYRANGRRRFHIWP